MMVNWWGILKQRLVSLYDNKNNISDTNQIQTSWIEVERYDRIRYSVYSDKSLDCYLEWSADKNNIFAESGKVSTSAGSGNGEDFANVCQYVRLRVENNSGGDTSSCRINLVGVRS